MSLLIVNADDFGLNAAANAGIIECHRAGSVTSTTLMANGPALDEAIQLARDHPKLGVGLHFNISWGKPLVDAAQVRSLVDADGNFADRSRLGRRTLIGSLKHDEVARELEAQYRRLRSLGIEITHVDSHQHVHAFGPVFSAVAALCERERIPMRVPWVAPDQRASLPRRFRRAMLANLLKRSTRRWSGRVRWNDALGSVFDLGIQRGPLLPDHYRTLLRDQCIDVFELMVHPVTSAAAMRSYTSVGEIGEAEYRWLRLGELPSLAESMGFRLGSYRDLH